MLGKYSSQQIKAAVAALNAYKEKPFVSHQWEELVLHLSQDNDPKFREKMSREMDTILDKDPMFKIFSLFCCK
jgi:hypothetical protein